MEMLAWHQRISSRYDRSKFELPCEEILPPSFLYSRESSRYVNQVGGPLGVYGVSTPGNEYHFYEYASRSKTEQKRFHSRGPYRPLLPTTPTGRPLTITQEKGDKKDKSASQDFSTWKLTTGVPSLTRETSYTFAIEHTTVHILRQPLSAWKDKYHGQKLPFMIQKVSTEMSVGVVIRNVMSAKIGEDFNQCKGWAITEIIEQGDGKWAKGSTVVYGSTKAAGPLSSMGWNAKRGKTLPPVWLTVHKFQGTTKHS